MRTPLTWSSIELGAWACAGITDRKWAGMKRGLLEAATQGQGGGCLFGHLMSGKKFICGQDNSTVVERRCRTARVSLLGEAASRTEKEASTRHAEGPRSVCAARVPRTRELVELEFQRGGVLRRSQ